MAPKAKLLTRVDGAVAAEFALTLPVILILILGAIVFGFTFYQWTMLEAATRAAAQYGQLHWTTWQNTTAPTPIRDKVYAAIPYCWSSGATPPTSASNSCSSWLPSANVTVQVACYCADGSDPMAPSGGFTSDYSGGVHCDGSCMIAIPGSNPAAYDTRMFKYIMITAKANLWVGGFSLPATIPGYTTARIQ